MKFRTTLIAFLLLVLSGVLVYLFEFRWARERQEREEEARKIFSLDWGDLQRVKIAGSHEPLVLERKAAEVDAAAGHVAAKDSGWRIVEPVRTDADDASILGLMTALKNLEKEQVIHESPADLEPFGLVEPAIRVELVLTEGKEPPAPLRVGGKSPVGENSYAMREGESAVLLLNAYVNPQIDKSLYDLRQKRVFPVDRHDIERLEVLQHGKLGWEMVRRDDRWNLVAPVRAPVSPEEADRILNKISGLTARSFEDEPPEDLEPYGLDSPRREVRLTLGPDQEQASLLVGAGRREAGRELVYAKRGEARQVVSLDAELLETLDADPEGFRDRKVFSFQPWKVEKVEMRLQEQEITLVKIGTGRWRIARPVDARASSSRISSFLSAMSRLEGTAFFDKPEDREEMKRFGLDVPAARVTLYEARPVPWDQEPHEYEEKLDPVGTVILGRPGGDRGPGTAWLEGSVTVAEVEETFFLEHLPEGVEDLRDRGVLDFHRYQAAALEFRHPQGAVVLEDEDGVWRVTEPVSRPMESGKVDDLLGFLGDLQVEQFLFEPEADPAELAEDPFGPDPPAASVAVRDLGGLELGTFHLSSHGPAEEPRLRYVRIVGEPSLGLIGADKGEELLARIRKIEARD